MLDIRAVAYVAPLSEVDFAPVTLTVRLVNYADETGLVTGTFRIYNGTTGLLIHTSDIVPVSMATGTTVDASALTNWDPPGPAVDTYFVMFDGIATNALVPDGIGIHLSQFYFDVKPAPLGPVPAGHAVTHEDTGVDEIDVTNLSGVLADAQTPEIHDNTKHNPVMEEAANKGIAGGYCGLPNPLDTTLPLRADGTAAHTEGTYIFTECTAKPQAGAFFGDSPWVGAAVSSGTLQTAFPAEKDHPGIHEVKSGTGASSGYYFLTDTAAILISGNETTDFIIRPQTLANTTIRLGFIDSITSSDENDGCYIEITTVGGIPGTLVGKTATAAARSTSATSYVCAAGVWYRARISVNAAANLVTFSLFDSAGALLWTDTLNANIPTAAGNETGHGIVALSNGLGSTVAVLDIDFFDIFIARTLTR